MLHLIKINQAIVVFAFYLLSLEKVCFSSWVSFVFYTCVTLMYIMNVYRLELSYEEDRGY